MGVFAFWCYPSHAMSLRFPWDLAAAGDIRPMRVNRCLIKPMPPGSSVYQGCSRLFSPSAELKITWWYFGILPPVLLEGPSFAFNMEMKGVSFCIYFFMLDMSCMCKFSRKYVNDFLHSLCVYAHTVFLSWNHYPASSLTPVTVFALEVLWSQLLSCFIQLCLFPLKLLFSLPQ